MRQGIIRWGGAGSRERFGRFAASLICIAPMSASMAGAQVLRVYDDPGGLIAPRQAEVVQLTAAGTRVEIGGQCNSTCTMYLSVPNVCVDPAGQFGFHGPSYYGKPLSPNDFEYWSQVMARHYREPLRSWFLNQGRYLTQGYYRLRGTDLIKIGYQSC